MRNHFIVFIIIFLVLSIFTRSSLYAYSASKHHKFMGEMASEESTLDEYLKNNLGFSGGINTKLTNPDEPTGEQTKTIKEWIGYGGIVEDKGFVFPLPRVARHFYDPVSNQGLNDHSPPVISSLEWGREQDGSEDDYSWTQARHYYYLALTSGTKEEREKYWALTFRSLGQVLHLVQDLASPAHVRNDNHLPVSKNADPYEEIWGTSPEGISFIHAILSHGALGNADYQYPVVELNQFDDYWDTEDGRGLAEFTNSNFVSKDTNLDKPPGDPHHYDSPQVTGEYRELFTFKDSTGTVRTIWVNYVTSNVVDNYAPGRSVNPFNYLTTHSFFNFYTEQYDLMQKSYTLNRKCHEEYAKLLIPRTVGYGAGLLDYFFRGELNMRTEIDLDGWLVFYVTTEGVDIEDLYNNIEIYKDDLEGIRSKIEDSDYHPFGLRYIEKEIVDNELKLKVDVYNSAVKFIIVYRGPVNEGGEEIVIGKVLYIVLNALHPQENHTGERRKVGEWEAIANYSNARENAYLNFINNIPGWSFHPINYALIGSMIRAHIGDCALADSGSIVYCASQEARRIYTVFDFSFFQDKRVDNVLFVLLDIGPDINNVELYRASSNNWPAYWDSGDIFIFSPSGPFYEGRYFNAELIESNSNLLNLIGLNIFETRYINDTLNYIPLAPVDQAYGKYAIYEQQWSAWIIEVIYYSEEVAE